VSNTLFCLLLALAGTLLCLSAGLWFSAHSALLSMDESITTIAIPDPFAVRQYVSSYIREYEAEHGEGEIDPAYTIIMYMWDDDSFKSSAVWDFGTLTQKYIQNIRDTVYPSGLLRMDGRRIFNAFAENIETYPMRTTGVGVDSYVAAYSPQATAAFIIRCEKIDIRNSIHAWFDEDGGTHRSRYIQRHYSAIFTIEEVLHLNPAYRLQQTIRISFYKNPDGSIPFERGKRYVAMGRYSQSGGGAFFGGLDIDMPEVDVAWVESGDIVRTNDELNRLIPVWGGSYYPQEDFPMTVMEYVYERVPEPGDGEYSFFELDDSLEDALASDQWERMNEALKIAEISSESFQVLTTNDANSLFRFNQRRNLMNEGRLFSSKEARDGARVCLISRQFADHNSLAVGDTVSLQMYNAVLGTVTATYAASEESMATAAVWIPSMYSHDLEISQPIEYTVVGIYNSFTRQFDDYAISPNTVIIPDKSFGSLEGEPVSRFYIPAHVPLLHDALTAPNGRIEETRAAINGIADGFGYMFRFYDQGYDGLKATLSNLRAGLSWVLVLSAASWGSVAFLFSMFYIARKRKEASVLHAVGVSRKKRIGWVFIQCAVLIILALCISLAAVMPIYGGIMDTVAAAAEEFTLSFRDLTLSDAVDEGIRSRIPLKESVPALIIAAAAGTLLMLIMAGFMSAKASAFGSLDSDRGDG
jgi:hypothetical protein